jgi:hypothetical protein
VAQACAKLTENQLEMSNLKSRPTARQLNRIHSLNLTKCPSGRLAVFYSGGFTLCSGEMGIHGLNIEVWDWPYSCLPLVGRKTSFEQFDSTILSEQTIVATSVATIGSALNIKGSLTWISTAYLLSTTVVQPISGRLAASLSDRLNSVFAIYCVQDAFGTKKLLIGAVWVFIAGNIIAGTSQSLSQIIAGRLIAGLGGAGLLSLCSIVVSRAHTSPTCLLVFECFFRTNTRASTQLLHESR